MVPLSQVPSAETGLILAGRSPGSDCFHDGVPHARWSRMTRWARGEVSGTHALLRGIRTLPLASQVNRKGQPCHVSFRPFRLP